MAKAAAKTAMIPEASRQEPSGGAIFKKRHQSMRSQGMHDNPCVTHSPRHHTRRRFSSDLAHFIKIRHAAIAGVFKIALPVVVTQIHPKFFGHAFYASGCRAFINLSGDKLHGAPIRTAVMLAGVFGEKSDKKRDDKRH